MAKTDITAVNAKTISVNGTPIAGSVQAYGPFTTFDQLDADVVLALNGVVVQGQMTSQLAYTNIDHLNVLSGISLNETVKYGAASTPASSAATGPIGIGGGVVIPATPTPAPTPTPTPTYGNLSLSTPLTAGLTVSNITIAGATSGSTITGNVPGLAVNSANRTASFDGSASAGSVANGLVESGLAGYTAKNNAVSVGAQGALSFSPSSPSIAANAAQGSLVFNISGVLPGVTPTIPSSTGFVVGGDATNGWKGVVGLNPLTSGTVNVVVSSQGSVSGTVPVTITAVNSVPQLTNPPGAMLAGSVGRLSAYPYGSSVDNVMQQFGGSLTAAQFLEPRVATTIYRIGDPFANAKGLGGLCFANDGYGFDSYEVLMPRIKAAAEAAIAAGTKLIVDYIISNNSFGLVTNATTFQPYLDQPLGQINRIIGWGAIVIVHNCAPRGTIAGGNFADYPNAPRYAYPAINNFWKSFTDARPTTTGYVDRASVLLDNVNAPYNPAVGMRRADQTHETTTGAEAVGELQAAAWRRFLAPSAPANRGTGANLIPTISTSSTTPVTGVTGVTGAIPAGYTLSRGTANGAAVVLEVIDVNGVPTLHGTATGTTGNESITLKPTTMPTFTTGKWYRQSWAVRFAAYSRWNERGIVRIADGNNKVWGGNSGVGNDGSPDPLAQYTFANKAATGVAATADGFATKTGAALDTAIAVGWGAGSGTVEFWLSLPELREQIDPRLLTFDGTITAPAAITSSPTISMDELAIVSVQEAANKPVFWTVDATAAANGVSIGLTTGVLKGPTSVGSQAVIVTAQPYDYRETTAATQAVTYTVTANANVFTDNFQRADGPLGAPWEDAEQGGGTNGLVVQGGKMGQVTTGGDGFLFKRTPQKGNTSNQRFSLSRNVSASTSFPRIFVACDGTSANGVNLRHNLANTITVSYTTTDGSGTKSEPNINSITTDNTAPAKFMYEVNGNVLSVYQNGAPIGSVDTTASGGIPSTWKRSGVRLNGGNLVPLFAVSATTSDQFAIKTNKMLKNITATTTEYTFAQSAGLGIDLNNVTGGAALNITSVTANTGTWNADGTTLRVSQPPVGDLTVAVVLDESDPNAANTGGRRSSTINLILHVTAG